MSEERKPNPDGRWVKILAAVIVLGLIMIGLFVSQAGSWQKALSAAAVASALAGAALLAGVLAGFLFGIPRRLQRNSETDGSDDAALYGANTNLEQISDWLTKILVGVGLTQLGQLGPALQAIGTWAGGGLGNGTDAQTFAVALVIFFAVAGFLIAYLWTRLRLGAEFSEVERKRRRLDRLEQQAQTDIGALALVARQLSADGKERPALVDLVKAVAATSSETRAHVFYRAQGLRERNWRNTETKAVMERTIPVFQALIAADSEGKYHANYGQLGFALKDQRQPDWAAAEAALTRAIDIRGDVPKDSEWRSYEFNRAVCRIRLDPQYAGTAPSADDLNGQILKDLTVARANPIVWSWRGDQAELAEWSGRNGIDLDTLKAEAA